MIFGAEDKFFNLFSSIATLSPVIPVVGGKTLFQPVYVDDVAFAVEKILTEHLQKKEQADVMKNMSRFQKDYYISEQRKKIVKELGL